MGHIHLGRLPNTKPWKAVVAMLEDRAADDAVIARAAAAAERDLANASRDETFVETLRLLAMVPRAAGSDDFGRELRRLGVDAPDGVGFAGLVGAVARRVDDHARGAGRTDFGALAKRVLIGALTAEIGDALPRLFGADAEDVRAATARLGSPRGFSRGARAYFGRLLADSLSSWLDRTLATHVGPDRRFPDVAGRAAFDEALVQYCAEATFIIDEFAAGWHAATLRRVGTIRAAEARVFGAVAFRKIGEELRLKRGADDDA